MSERGRLRSGASVALAALAAVCAIAAVTCIYLRAEILSPRRFADRTAAALDTAPVRRVVARELVAQVVDRASPDLLAARPVITSAVEAFVATRQFRGIVHALAGQAHRLLFDRGGNVVFSIADAGTVVISALRTLAPGVASKIPQNVDAKLLDLRKQSFATETLRVADDVRVLAVVLPPVALALLAIALALARRRRAALMRCGVALAVVGIAMFFDLALLRHSMLTRLFGAEELSDADVREAAGALWDAYMGGLSSWMLGLAAFGSVLAAVSTGLLRARRLAGAAAWLREREWPPVTRRQRVGVGVPALALGAALIARPTLTVDVFAVIAGLGLCSFGVDELLMVAGLEPPPLRPPTLRGSRLAGASVAATLAMLVGGVAIALAADRPSASHAPAVATAITCNGYAQLCSRRLDQVVFAGTHNSMSAAESPGWLIANQERAIARQLDDGIRAFKISTHYGIGSSPGHIRTDIEGEGKRLNRVSEKLDAQARAALQRFSGSVGFGRASGKRGVWLCHTLCELGATSMASFLGTVDLFLRKNPDQVLVFFDEDYVAESSLESEFKRSGLYSHLAVLRAGQQLPTLGELVRSQHNVVVFTQEPVSGRYPWDMYAFGDWIQDTPLGAVKPSQFTCKLSRGVEKNPLLMMNNWADVFPPRRSPNLPLLKRNFILARARRCERERHHLPNLILTDFYNSGDVVGAVRELNGLGKQKPAPIAAIGRR
jgi:hypothetical protein